MKYKPTPRKKLFSRSLRRNQTIQESILWSYLRSRRLHKRKFRRQYAIGKYIVDFVCIEKSLIIELDGRQHGEEKREYDVKRDEFLTKSGFRVLRFWDGEVNINLEGVLLEIGEYL